MYFILTPLVNICVKYFIFQIWFSSHEILFLTVRLYKQVTHLLNEHSVVLYERRAHYPTFWSFIELEFLLNVFNTTTTQS